MVVGGKYVTAFMKAVPCEDMAASKAGGGEDIIFHNRTVASLDADITVLGDGKTTARTYMHVMSILLNAIQCEQ